MFQVNIINHAEDFILDEIKIQGIANEISKDIDIPQIGIINIAFLSDEEIEIMNREYRWIDRSTDVLSFHYFDDFSLVTKDEIAGEIILSESKILLQSLEHNHAPIEECEILIIHGLLHILGFDHETDVDYQVMWKYEEILREKFWLRVS